jgi:hypothetical protein
MCKPPAVLLLLGPPTTDQQEPEVGFPISNKFVTKNAYTPKEKQSQPFETKFHDLRKQLQKTNGGRWGLGFGSAGWH